MTLLWPLRPLLLTLKETSMLSHTDLAHLYRHSQSDIMVICNRAWNGSASHPLPRAMKIDLAWTRLPTDLVTLCQTIVSIEGRVWATSLSPHDRCPTLLALHECPQL